MASQERRQVIQMGSSKGITLPKPWCDYHGDALGEEVTVLGNAILLIAPRGFEEKAKRVLQALEQEGNEAPPSLEPVPAQKT